jgi:5,10-methylenetetrahydromethanopterin reductase
MKIGFVSAAASDPATTLDQIVEEAQGVEADGFAFYCVPSIFGLDAVSMLMIAGRETSSIELLPAVVPSPPRHPAALAQQALTAQAACRGRFTLGIGLSHEAVIDGMYGLSYKRPAKQMREYLSVLGPLLEGKQVAFEGEIYRVHALLQVAGAERVPLLVAALGPLMLRAAGELSDGTATWMTGLQTLASHIVPTISKAASAAGRAAPRILSAVPIALTSQPEQAREVCNRAFKIYGQLPSYRAMLDREGVADPGGLALVGDESELRAGLQRYREAGVTDFAPSMFAAEDGAVARTREFLKSEA